LGEIERPALAGIGTAPSAFVRESDTLSTGVCQESCLSDAQRKWCLVGLFVGHLAYHTRRRRIAPGRYLRQTSAISWNTSCLRATTTATLTPIACLHCSPAFVFSVVPALAAIRYLESRRTVYKHEDFATHFIVALSPLNA
jgi:hypothetical protein